jgi:predicted transposase/invertase (TIGR01784 family)
VFKAVFTKNTPQSQGALDRLLSAFTGRRLRAVSVIVNELPIDNLRDRQIRFDIHCKCGSEVLNIEMSLNPDAYEPARLEFHAGKLLTGQDIRGRDKTYGDLKDSYQIAFLVKGRIFPDGEFLHRFEYYDRERDMPLGGRSRIIAVELTKVAGEYGKAAIEMTPAERWAYYFKYITDRGKREKINEIIESEEGIAMASEVLLGISRDEMERARLISEYKYAVDMQSHIVQARREGKRDGELKGRQERAREIARDLKFSGIAVEQISRAAGLSAEEIAAL